MPLLQAKVMVLEMAVPLKKEGHWANIGLWHHLEEEEEVRLQHPLLVLLQIPIHSIGVHEDGGAGTLTVSIVTFCKGVFSKISSSSLSITTSSCASPLHNKMVMANENALLALGSRKKSLYLVCSPNQSSHQIGQTQKLWTKLLHMESNEDGTTLESQTSIILGFPGSDPVLITRLQTLCSLCKI